MKTLILTLLATSALASSELAPCDPLDWSEYGEALKSATRTEEAIRLRENSLEHVCNLVDYYRLTQMETHVDSEHLSLDYIRRLKDFTVNNFDSILLNVRFSQVSNDLYFGFLIREKDRNYRHAIRSAFYTTVRNCDDVSRVTRVLTSDDWTERRQLHRDSWRLERRYCY
jgi:hypothetical protein